MAGEAAVDNVAGKEEKRVKKKSKKGRENEGSGAEIQEAQDIGKMKAVEGNSISEKEDGAEMKKGRKRDKEKKKNKATEDAEAEIKSSAEEGELTVAYGRGSSGDAKDNGERKRKNEDKNESEKLPEGENISGASSYEDAGRERKKKKAKRSHEDGDAEEGKNVGTDSRNSEIPVIEDVERKKKKKEKKRSKDDNNQKENSSEAKQDKGDLSSQLENVPDNRIGMGNTNAIEGNESSKLTKEESISVVGSNRNTSKERKTGKAKRSHEDREAEKEENGTDSRNSEIRVFEDVERKKRKKEKKRSKDNSFQEKLNEAKHDEVNLSLQLEHVPDNLEGNNQSTENDRKAAKELKRKKKSEMKEKSNPSQQDAVDKDTTGPVHSDEIQNDEVENANKIKKKKNKKKTKLVETSNEAGHGDVEYADKDKKEKNKSAKNGPDVPTPSKSNKKVRFSDQDEVFPLPRDSDIEMEIVDKDNLVRGKRFTPEEDEIVKEAVLRYITEHNLGDEGLDMVLNCKKNPEVRGCWKEIGSAIPYRPYISVYYRAHNLFQRSEHRKWTKEEYEMILKYQEEHGNEWKVLADELGKHRFHVKDTWRRIKLRNMNKGHWKQEEYQQLFDLVNTDLQAKVMEEKRSKHGMLRDNICWTVISDKLSTRAQANCCVKWYKQLTSPMVAEGIWADTDDYRMIGALYSLDATCMEDVDWDDLVEGRGGDVCRKRWNQMALHLGKNGRKSFAEQVEVLAERYCPHLLEARETWDSKPRVP